MPIIAGIDEAGYGPKIGPFVLSSIVMDIGNDIAKGTVDVIVTDGFTGNIAIKTAEGTARLIADLMRSAFQVSWRTRIGYYLARPAIRALRERLDPSTYNGGVFLGLNGIAVKSHGGTDGNGFATAIGLAIDMAADDMIEQIRADFEKLNVQQSTPSKSVAGVLV